MVNGTEVMQQEVISDNQKIFEAILHNINSSTREILVATSWFTDDLLFNALLRKSAEGVVVDLIMSDNQENEKLNFDELLVQGASVIRIRNVGYGIMHQKFCIVDRHTALHGSYNWSVNARNNNHESIILTTHKQTVDSLVKTFFEIKAASVAIMNGEEPPERKLSLQEPQVLTSEKPAEMPSKTKDFDFVSEFTRILDSMIAAEVSNFDRDLLRRQGYERAKSNNGDAQVLGNAYDSIYSVFINEINVVEDKKKRLISKIEEQKSRSILGLQESTELQIATLEIGAENQEANLSKSALRLTANIAKAENEIERVNNIQIPAIEEKNAMLKEEILTLQQAYIPPVWKLHEIIPLVVLNVLLLAYLTLFYSSAAYILLFSETDAKVARLNGIQVEPPEVFDPEAISKVLDKDGTAIFYIFLFVALPLAFAVIKISQNKTLNFVLSMVLGVVVLDTFLAYKVAKSIHEIEYLTGKVDTVWVIEMVLQNANFYLVFVLGAMGLLIFKIAFNRVTGIMDDRSPDENARRKALAIQQHKTQIEENLNAIQKLNEHITSVRSQMIDMKVAIDTTERELQLLPAKKASQVEKLRNESLIKVQIVEATTIVYKSHIENDDLPVSVNSMKDRINIFLEGWNDLLCEEFAVVRAKEKCAQAVEAAAQWLDEKLKGSIDKRINLN